MGLEEYKRKRKFTQTPEPAPKPVKTAKAQHPCQYFVQRHDATRLHYDLRLEVDGVLKSWAVPKGPSLDPTQKRLAMMVEDHPMDYGTFEGNIPSGNYGAGSVMLWDRGTFEPEGDQPAAKQIANGELKFNLDGEKLQGSFVLVRMKRGKGNEWLLIKHRDEAAVEGWGIEEKDFSITTKRSQQEIAAPVLEIEPMKAVLAEEPPAGKGWLYEIKWDGVRALAHIERGSAEFFSRKGERITGQYPELSGLAKFLKADDAIVDGEIVAVDEKGVPHFQLLQPRIMAASKIAIAEAARQTPVTYYLFDLLQHNGVDLRNKPLIERKELLKSILTNQDRFRYSEHFQDQGPKLLEQARNAGLEGVMAKRADSRYESKRSSTWVKIKLVQQQEFVICGYTKGERTTFGSLMLGVYEDGKLEYAGNVGTGFNETTLRTVFSKLQPLIVPKSPFKGVKLPQNKGVVWVQPELVCEVKFAQWTHDRHLRAPVFLGLRPDASPEDCVREKPGEEPEPLPEPAATNISKIFFPKLGLTKGDVLAYYEEIADLLLPHLENRPLSLKRYPNGVEGKFFFQKNPPPTFPDYVKAPGENPGDPGFIVCNSREALLYLVNLGCIDHNPWMSRIGSLDNPDYILLDLDANDCPFSMVAQAAKVIHGILNKLEITGYPKTTGGDGMHIYIPLAPKYTYDQAKSFAEILSLLSAEEHPDLFTTPRAFASRKKNRVYFDHLQIGKGKTISAPYVVRPNAGALVATPLDWKEVTPKLTPEKFHLGNAVARFRKHAGLFDEALTNKQELGQALKNFARLTKA